MDPPSRTATAAAGIEGRFKEINEAYTVLSDPQKRAAYDRFGHAGVNGGGGGGGFGGFAGGGDMNDIFNEVFGDVFGDMFGGRGGQRQQNNGPRRGADLRYDLEITLEQAHKGAEVEITAQTSITCETCEGSGAKKGASPPVCGSCGGAGRVRARPTASSQVERTCPRCGGAGKLISATRLHDVPRPRPGAPQERTLQVRIPAGVDDGSRIRLDGRGRRRAARRPARRPLCLPVRAPHELFERDNLDLHVHRAGADVRSRPWAARSRPPAWCEARRRQGPGGEVPAGSQTGKHRAPEGQGHAIPALAQRGDLVVELFVETPTELTPRQKELMQELAQSFGESQNPRNTSFAGKAKRFWADILGAETDSSKETAA
jgi:molecular chaperone DnaJ